MASPLGPPGCPYDPGAEWPNDPIDVRTVTLHRTIGRWLGDYSVGKNRTHAQGTFQHLIGQGPGEWVQFYPANNFASHAAGANNAGPGIEISGQNGEPLTDWQIDALGQILRWYRDEWGIVPTFADGDPRVYADQLGPLGFITHRHVYYPDPFYIHHDYITEDEFARALGGGKDDDDVKASIIAKEGEPFLYVWVDGYKYPTKNRQHAALMHFFGHASNGADNPLVLSAADFDSIPDAVDVFPVGDGGAGGAAVPLTMTGTFTGTATP